MTMKRILTFVVAVLCSAVVFAQANYSQHLMSGNIDRTQVSALKVERAQKKTRAGEIWQCTFEEETPLYTTGQLSSSQANWELQTLSTNDGGTYYWNLNYLPDDLYSETPDHWMMLDGGGIVRQGYDFDSYMMFTGIDLTDAEYPQIGFYEYRRLVNIPPEMEATVVEVSINGGATWTKHVVGCEEMAEHSFGYQLVPIFEAAGRDNVVIRFRSNRRLSVLQSTFGAGINYNSASFITVWQVDDIVISEAPAFDLVITDVRMNDGRCDLYSNPDAIAAGYSSSHYQLNPMFGQTPVTEWQSEGKFASFNVAVENKGAEPVDPIVHITVTSPSGEEIWATDFEGAQIGPYQRDTIDVIDFVEGEGDQTFIANVFAFDGDQMQNIELGRYLVSYSVSTEAGDDPTPNNNKRSHPFYITQSAYSPATPNITTTTGPNTWGSFAEGDEIVAIFEYNTLPEGDIPVYVYIHESTNPGTAIAANIYEYSPESDGFELSLSSGTHTITADEIGKWIEVPFGETHFTIEEYDPESSTKTVEVGIAFYENGDTLNMGGSNDMPNKGWICRYIMGGEGPSGINVSSESDAPAICLGVPPTTDTIFAAIGSEGGRITPSSTSSHDIIVLDGTNFTFTITPDDCMQIASVMVDGEEAIEDVVDGVYTFTNVTENHSIIPYFEPIPYTIAVTANEGGAINPAGEAGEVTVNCGADQAFTVVPGAGYRILSVLVDDEEVELEDDTYTFTNVRENHTIVANFMRIHDVTVTVVGNGTVTPDGEQYVDDEEDFTFSVEPADCYQVDSVKVNGEIVDLTENAYTIETITEDAQTVDVYFGQITYDITVTAGENGAITPSTEGVFAANCGEDQTFTIAPEDGYYIETLTVDGQEVPTSTAYTFRNVREPHTIAATFAEIPADQVVVVVNVVTEGGAVTPEGTTLVTEGEDFTFTAAPEACYAARATVNGTEVTLTENAYTIENVEAAQTIEVSFYHPTFTITATAGEHGTITETSVVDCGSDTAFVITPADCYRIAEVTVDGEPAELEEGVYTFTNVTADHTIAATFEIITYTITTTAGEGGTITETGEVNCGDNKEITVTANEGYRILSVIVDAETENEADVTSQLVEGVYTFTAVAEAHTIAATFKKVHEVAITIEGEGTVTTLSGSGEQTVTVDDGASFSFNVNYDECHTVAVTVNDEAVTLTENAYIIENVTEDKEINVVFSVKDPYTITAIAGEGGSIDPDGEVSVDCGGEKTFTVTINEGYSIDKVLVDEVSDRLTADNTYIFTNVVADHTIEITFKKDDDAVDMIEAGSLSIYPNPNNGMFSIDFSRIEGDATFQLIDARGAIVDTRDINVTDGDTMTFDYNLHQGAYFVRIISADKVYVEQIVIE